jgi:Asparagine synthase (glutamine-hydrolyzing)
MCRLAGFTDTRVSQKYNKRAILTAMRDALLDGGPDASQVLMDGPLAIAHTRLAIQDLSESAGQPMERGHHVLAWNGELYNFRELRAELTAEGFAFESGGDTEVALQAFRR